MISLLKSKVFEGSVDVYLFSNGTFTWLTQHQFLKSVGRTDSDFINIGSKVLLEWSNEN